MTLEEQLEHDKLERAFLNLKERRKKVQKQKDEFKMKFYFLKKKMFLIENILLDDSLSDEKKIKAIKDISKKLNKEEKTNGKTN